MSSNLPIIFMGICGKSRPFLYACIAVPAIAEL